MNHDLPEYISISIVNCMSSCHYLNKLVTPYILAWTNWELYLSDTSLTPVDCLSIGYFLSTVSLTTSNAKEFKVYLINNCSLGNVGVVYPSPSYDRLVIILLQNTHYIIIILHVHKRDLCDVTGSKNNHIHACICNNNTNNTHITVQQVFSPPTTLPSLVNHNATFYQPKRSG